jgi:hypothetical protein
LSLPSKFRSGSKAKGAAKRDFSKCQAGKNPTSRQSGGGLFAESFSPKPLYGQPGNFNIPKSQFDTQQNFMIRDFLDT